VRHIDAVIQICLGLAFTWMGFRGAGRFGPRAVRIFRVCGPALIVIGGLLLLQPAAAPDWRRQYTSDKVASAEFPGSVTPKERVDTAGGVSVTTTSLTYDVPGRDIALFLSYSALAENARGLTDAQRIEGALAVFASQGMRVVENEHDGPVYRVTVRQDDKKATMQTALAYVSDGVYRAVASWIDGQEDKALTDRFVRSFRVTPPR
jgi:hypothetical protein